MTLQEKIKIRERKIEYFRSYKPANIQNNNKKGPTESANRQSDPRFNLVRTLYVVISDPSDRSILITKQIWVIWTENQIHT